MLRQALIERMRSDPSAAFGSGATPEQIRALEDVLGVRLPGSYRHFLAEFGWGGIRDLEVFGTGADVPAFLDVARLTASERTEAHPRMHPNLIPVSTDGAGNYYCIDGVDWRAEGPVVFWDHEASEDQDLEEVAVDFATWLDDRVQSYLEAES